MLARPPPVGPAILTAPARPVASGAKETALDGALPGSDLVVPLTAILGKVT